MTPPGRRRPIMVCANPAVQLFDHGRCTVYASCWRVDWSVHGAGTALVVWRPDEVVVVGRDERLAGWLADGFVRHFPELDGLAWARPRVVSEEVIVEVDLAAGFRAAGGGFEVEATDVLDRRTFATDDFALAEPHSLSLVLAPCATGTVAVDGRAIGGLVRRGPTASRPSSSAFVTDAEVWSR